MKNYTNKELVKIYNACWNIFNNGGKITDENESNFLLKVYKENFESELELEQLHFYMVREIYEKVKEEMANRFSTMDW
jgi:uncharacterized protein involved in tolerance to divalent cations